MRKIAHKDNKNSRDNAKSGQKTQKELAKMRIESADEIGYSKESTKLGRDKSRREDR